MPNERISMLKLKQLMGLQSSNLRVRALARALGLSVGAVSKYLRAVRSCGIEAAEAKTLGGRTRAAGVRGGAGGKAGGARVARLHVDPRRAQAPSARDAAAAVGGVRGALRRGGFSPQRVLPDLPPLAEASEALDAPATLCRLR